MAVGIKAPVGETKRESKGAPVKNAKADVELVQLLLVANGTIVPTDGKCTTALIKAINAFQKSKAGIKKPDGIVDPGGRTWKAGAPKLEAKIKADLNLVQNFVTITENGKTKNVPKIEYERTVKEVQRKLKSKADFMYGQAECWLEFSSDASATAAGSEGFMMSFTSFIVSSVSSGKSEPPYGPLYDASGQAFQLQLLLKNSKPDWTKIYKQENKATKAYNKGRIAFDKFIQTRISTASSIVGKLEVVREVSFAAVEAYMTARLVATKGMSPMKAHALAAAGTEAMKSSAGQFGEYLAGNKVTWSGAAKKVFIDTAFAGAAGAVGGKLTGAFANQVVGKMSLYLAPKVSSVMGKKALNVFLNKIMSTKAMEELVKSAAKETVGFGKIIVEKGRLPNEKELKEAMTKSITSGLLGISPIKALQSFDKALPGKSSEFLSKTLAPKLAEGVRAEMIKKYGAAAVAKLPQAFHDKLFAEVADGVKGKAAELYALAAANGSNGDTKEAQLHKLGQIGVKSDPNLRKQMQAIMRVEMDKKLKSLEKAK